MAVDRGRIVREAVAVVLADLEAKGDELDPRPPAARVVTVVGVLIPVRVRTGRIRLVRSMAWTVRAHAAGLVGVAVAGPRSGPAGRVH